MNVNIFRLDLTCVNVPLNEPSESLPVNDPDDPIEPDVISPELEKPFAVEY